MTCYYALHETFENKKKLRRKEITEAFLMLIFNQLERVCDGVGEDVSGAGHLAAGG